MFELEGVKYNKRTHKNLEICKTVRARAHKDLERRDGHANTNEQTPENEEMTLEHQKILDKSARKFCECMKV